MRDDKLPAIDAEGPVAPPRRNGELVFQEPWEGRAFGLAVTLQDEGVLRWEAFRDRLIAAIAEADRHPDAEKPGYYESWLRALEHALIGGGLLTAEEVRLRVQRLAAEESA
jgi:nitrile hydratase accessory protein